MGEFIGRGQRPLEYIHGVEEYMEMWERVPGKVRNELAGGVWELPDELNGLGEIKVRVELYMDTSWRQDLKGRRVVLLREDPQRRMLLAEWALIRRRFTGGDGVTRVVYDNPISGGSGLVVEEEKLMAVGLPVSGEGERTFE